MLFWENTYNSSPKACLAWCPDYNIITLFQLITLFSLHTVHLVDVFNMIEAFRENGLNTLDHNTELHETRLEAIVSSIFYALNKRLPTTNYIDVERSISLVTNWLLYAYDR